MHQARPASRDGGPDTETLAIYALFGEYTLVRPLLKYWPKLGLPTLDPLKNNYTLGWWPSGKAADFTPRGRSGDINGTPSYTLWWILGLADYTLYSGDNDLVKAVPASWKKRGTRT